MLRKKNSIHNTLVILGRIGKIDCEREFFMELIVVHPVFHIFMLKKYVDDLSLILPLETIRIKDSLSYGKILVQILDF